jgi:hypothetical protein
MNSRSPFSKSTAVLERSHRSGKKFSKFLTETGELFSGQQLEIPLKHVDTQTLVRAPGINESRFGSRVNAEFDRQPEKDKTLGWGAGGCTSSV